MKFNTPLRCAGGRKKLGGFIETIIAQNNLFDGHYVEPYAGSAGIALNLLARGYVSCVHLNDANPAIYAFWYCVINQPEVFCKVIHDTEITTNQWQRQIAILNSPKNHSPLELGFAFFFLNRINRLGILWGGSINGKNQHCRWKLDARFNKVDLIRRIEWIAHFGSHIRLYNLDVADLIKTVLPTLPNKTLIYIDPPYRVKKYGLHENHSFYNDHVKVTKLIKEHIAQYWIATYENEPEVIKMYSNCTYMVHNTKHNARDRVRDSKVIFFSRNLIVSNLNNSSNLKIA